MQTRQRHSVTNFPGLRPMPPTQNNCQNEGENPSDMCAFLVSDEGTKVSETQVLDPEMKVWDHCGTSGIHL